MVMSGHEGSCKTKKGYDRFIMIMTDNDMSSLVMGGCLELLEM